jgi:hypothetical protein
VIRQALRGLILVGAFTLCTVGARAAPGDATRLEYARSQRASYCPNRDVLKSAVAKRLGYDPFFPAARQTIVVEITDTADGLRAQMHLIDENGMIVGSRELRDNVGQCDELVASLALAISIALDPSAALGAEPDAASEPTTPEPHAATGADDAEPTTPAVSTPVSERHLKKPAANEKRAPSHNAAATIHQSVRIAGFSALGIAPALAVGFRPGAGLRWEWFQVLAEFADQLPRTDAVASNASVRASLYAGNLLPCFGAGQVAGCGVLSLGSFHWEGRDIASPAKRRSLYAAAGARFEWTPKLFGRLHLLVAADALKSLTPINLRLRGEQVWKSPPFSAALAAGLTLQFP